MSYSRPGARSLGLWAPGMDPGPDPVELTLFYEPEPVQAGLHRAWPLWFVAVFGIAYAINRALGER